MATVVVSPFDVANFPEGGGHFWVYMQYAQGLRRLGCDVYWLEQFRRGREKSHHARPVVTFFQGWEGLSLGERGLPSRLALGCDAPLVSITGGRGAARTGQLRPA